MSYPIYNIKELVVAKILTDPSGGTTGPTYGPKVRWKGAQSLQINLSAEQQKLLGDGILLDAQSQLDEVGVQIESALMNPEAESVVYNLAQWETPEKTVTAYDEDSGGAYIGVWARTDKVGANGEDVVFYFPRITFGTMQKNQAQRAHRTHQFTGSALFTESGFEVIREGVVATKRAIWFEYNNRTGASLISVDTTVPTLLTSAITSHPVGNNFSMVFSKSLSRNSVNKYTLTLKTTVGSTPFAFTFDFATTTLTDDTLVINPTGNLAGATAYTAALDDAAKDTDGIHPASNLTLSVTTA